MSDTEVSEMRDAEDGDPGRSGEFGRDALPYGIFSTEGTGARVGARLGDDVVDLPRLALDTEFDAVDLLVQPTLDGLLAAGRPTWTRVRAWLREQVAAGVDTVSFPLDVVRLHNPFTVADYVDFYASRHHATNVGRMFRPDDAPLLPNWTHLPVGYHGRAGTVVVSGTDVVRPCGQLGRPDDGGPAPFGPSRKLDIEAEVGFVVGAPSNLGTPVPASAVRDHVFGVALVNDWSARDIQAWEYRPLGPFLGKSFATSISPWVLPLEALDAARVPPPHREHPLAGYLVDDPDEPWGLDLSLEVELNGTVIARPPFRLMYWTVAQQLAHLTINGATVRTGDLFASGTVSGPEPDQRGSLLELTWNGAEPLLLDDSRQRTFLADGDVVTIRATAPGVGGTPIALGDVSGRILPAR